MGLVTGLFMGVFAFLLSLAEYASIYSRRLIAWVQLHPKTTLLAAVGVIALLGMIFLLMQRGGDDQLVDGGEDVAPLVELPDVPPAASTPALDEDESIDDAPAPAAEPVGLPAFLQTRQAQTGGGTAARPSSNTARMAPVGLAPRDAAEEPVQLAALMSQLNRLRSDVHIPTVKYRWNEAVLDEATTLAGSMSYGVHPLHKVAWQFKQSRQGNYLPSLAYVYVCDTLGCHASDLVNYDRVFMDPLLESYAGTYLSFGDRSVYLVEVAPQYIVLEKVPPLDRDGQLTLHGAMTAGASVGTLQVTLHYRRLDSGGSDYGTRIVELTNPARGTDVGEGRLSAGRWDTRGQSFDITADFSEYFEDASDGYYTLLVRSVVGTSLTDVLAYTVKFEELVDGTASLKVTPTPTPFPTTTPWPTRSVSLGRSGFPPGFDGLRIDELSERDWGVNDGRFLLLACRADEEGPPVRWAEGVVFTPDGDYQLDSEMAVLLVPGNVYPQLDRCYRLLVSYERMGDWKFCRRPDSCGAAFDLQVMRVPYYVVSGRENWEELMEDDRCQDWDPDEVCWSTVSPP